MLNLGMGQTTIELSYMFIVNMTRAATSARVLGIDADGDGLFSGIPHIFH